MSINYFNLNSLQLLLTSIQYNTAVWHKCNPILCYYMYFYLLIYFANEVCEYSLKLSNKTTKICIYYLDYAMNNTVIHVPLVWSKIINLHKGYLCSYSWLSTSTHFLYLIFKCNIEEEFKQQQDHLLSLCLLYQPKKLRYLKHGNLRF